MKFAYTVLMRRLVLTVLVAGFGSPSIAAEVSFDVGGLPFKSALRYSFAKTVCFTLELNWWTSFRDQASFTLTQKVRERLGAAVKVDVYVHREEAERELIYVAFPDFQVAQNTFVLLLPRVKGKFLSGSAILNRFAGSPRDKVYRQVNFTLPEDCQSVVTNEFRLQPEYVQRIRRMANEAIEEAYPGGADTSHVFFRPFSPRFDVDTTFYWLEGKKILRVDLPQSPDNRPVAWKELFDFQRGIESKKLADQATFYLRMSHEISGHVVNGLMLALETGQTKKPH